MSSLLLRYLPQCDFREVHRQLIRAESHRVLNAFRTLSLQDTPLVSILMGIRPSGKRAHPARFASGFKAEG
jgi:hypothetical protein